MNKKITVLGGLLMAVVMTAYSVSGTYAKYTSTFTGSDSARVAKWAFKINDKAATTNTVTFDLFKTINDSDGSAENDVKKGVLAPDAPEGSVAEKIIAPGTSGSFDIKLQNDSEVNAKYSISLSADTTDIPLEFSVGNGVWEKDLSKLKIDSKAINMSGGNATETIQWRWVFEKTTTTSVDGVDKTVVDAENDKKDTDLGIDGTKTITVTATITATQVD